ncbi:hypothetical protein PSH80_10445 [Pseudomonas sp. FP818]|nr:hypothetical protein [Pseudomonas sp. FP818]WLI36715.1 hypothetical protein PSH80_10445 [Pseudomonas sp. FP818]
MFAIAVLRDDQLIGGIVQTVVDDVVELGLAHLAFEIHQVAGLVREPATGGFHDRVGNRRQGAAGQVEAMPGVGRAFRGGIHKFTRPYRQGLEAVLAAAIGRHQGLHPPTAGLGCAGQENLIGVFVAGPYRRHAHGLSGGGGHAELRDGDGSVRLARQAGIGRPAGVHRPVQGDEQLPAKAIHKALAGGVEVVDRHKPAALGVEHQLLLDAVIGIGRVGQGQDKQ